MSENGNKTALLVIDMLNPYEHEDADKLVESVETAVPAIRKLLDRAAEVGTEVIYVNDNYGDWTSSPERIAADACDGKRPDLVEPVLPSDGRPS